MTMTKSPEIQVSDRRLTDLILALQSLTNETIFEVQDHIATLVGNLRNLKSLQGNIDITGLT